MYGGVSIAAESAEIPGTILPNTFIVYKVTDTPTGGAKTGTIAVKAFISITSFSVLCREDVSSLSITSVPIFNNAPVGAVFYLMKLGTSAKLVSLNPRYALGRDSGAQVYQKLGTSGNLSAVQAWLYFAGRWRNLNA